MHIFIGVRLSEPHTSGTALQDTCVCLLAAIYHKFLNTHKYFLKIEHPRALMAMLGYCQSAASATVVETAQVKACTAPYFLFVTAATDHQQQAARRRYELYTPG